MKIELPWRGLLNTTVAPGTDKKRKLASWHRKRLYEHMSNQLANGQGVADALKEYRDRLYKRGRKGPALAVHLIYLDYKGGKTLVSAMSEHITDLERTLIAAGETSARLKEMLDLVLDIRERIFNLTMGMLGSFFAPATYIVAMYAALMVIGFAVIPSLLDSLPIARWRGWAYVMYLMGQSATGWFAPTAIALVVASTIVVWRALPRWTGNGRIKGRVFCDRYVFPFTVYREIKGFAWLLSYTALLRGGVSNATAIRNAMLASPPWLASRLFPLYVGIREGEKLSVAMDQAGHGFPSLDLIDEISSYSKFGNFEEKIEAVAKQHSTRLLKVLLFKGVLISLFCQGVIFFMMAVVQLGSNSIANALTTAAGG